MFKILKSAPEGETRDFFKILLSVSVPIILQNLLHASVNLVDTMMVSTLGDIAVAAVGISNQVYFIFHLVMFGVASGISVFISQYWGNKDTEGIHKSIGIGFSVLLPIMLIGSIVVFAIPKTILSLFTADTAVLLSGANYIRIVCVSYIFSAITLIWGQSLRSTECVRIPFITTTISLAVNVILNAFLIFGLWIFPEMGVKGAALATCIARIIESIVLAVLIYGNKLHVAIRIKSAFNFTWEFFVRFVKTSAPVMATETLWGLGTTLFFAVYGRMSTELLTAVNVAKVVETFVLVFYWGFAGASAVTVGKYVGSDQRDKARRYAYRFLITGFVSGIILGAILLGISNPMLGWFQVSQEVKAIAKVYILLFSAFLMFRGTSAIATVGILRSGGDTRTAMLLDIIPLWFITLPLMYLAGIVWGAPYWVVLIIAMAYDPLRLGPCLIRIFGDKWMRNVAR